MPLNESKLNSQEELLPHSPLFSSFIRRDISTVKHNENEMLFNRQGEFDSFNLDVSEKIKLFRVSLSGQEKIIELVIRGRDFAEALMFSENPIYPLDGK